MKVRMVPAGNSGGVGEQVEHEETAVLLVVWSAFYGHPEQTLLGKWFYS